LSTPEHHFVTETAKIFYKGYWWCQVEVWSMRILLAIDDSPSSADAVEIVAERSWPMSPAIRVLSIAKFVPAELHASPETRELSQQEATRMAERLTSRATDVLRANNLMADMAVRCGDAADQIVNEAQEWSADLIVMGANSYKSEGAQIHSVAQLIASSAPCEVEVIYEGEAADRRDPHW